MRIPTTAVLLCMVGVSACYRTNGPTDGVSDAGLSDTGSDERCGETVVTAYLVPSMSCFTQSDPQFLDYNSREDVACRLDVYASETAPDSTMAEVCRDKPFTSLCFLERIGMIDDVVEGFEGTPRVALEGYMREMTLCELTEKGEDHQTCRVKEVFYPCTADPL